MKGVADDTCQQNACDSAVRVSPPHCSPPWAVCVHKHAGEEECKRPPTGCPSCLLRMSLTMEEKDQVDRREERECREWCIGRGEGGMSMSLSGFTAHSPSS